MVVKQHLIYHIPPPPNFYTVCHPSGRAGSCLLPLGHAMCVPRTPMAPKTLLSFVLFSFSIQTIETLFLLCGGDTKHSVLPKGGRGQQLSCLSSVQIKAGPSSLAETTRGQTHHPPPSRRPVCTTGVPAAPGPKKFLCGCLWALCV